MSPGAPIEPGDGLLVAGGGTTAVATDYLLAQAACLTLLGQEVIEWQVRLRHILALEETPAPAWVRDDVGSAVFSVARDLERLEENCQALTRMLVTAADEYSRAERSARLLVNLSGAAGAWLLGRLAPVLAAAAIPAMTGGVAAWLLGAARAGIRPDEVPDRLVRQLRRDPRLLTHPALVQAARTIVSAADDAGAGAFGVPFPVAVALGDQGAGALGVATSSAALLALTRPLGIFEETPVSVARAGRSAPAPPPRGLADLVSRIPPVSPRGPQVRIERYAPGRVPAYVVYIGGTAAWSPVTGEEPWDLTSNLTAVARQRSGSYRSVVTAMRRAGVEPGDPVIVTGHSQGGLLAAQVAASGRFNTVALATFGAPTAQQPLPPTLPALLAEHTDDLVPAFGGGRNEQPEGAGPLLVRREAFASGQVPAGDMLPAHGLARYRDTAALIDASAEPRLAGFRALIPETLGTDPGVTTWWRAIRTRPGGD